MSSTIWILIALILGFLVLFQIAKATEYVSILKGEEKTRIDTMIHITLIITGIVFEITQILLFWFSFKYQEKENKTALYYPHNNRLEVIWTVIPAIVLTVLVGFGLYYWFQVTGEAPKDAIVIEVTGKQFNWEFRYPGRDGVFGKKYFKNVDETKGNPLGQIWDDPANRDDIYTTGEMHI